MVQKKQFFKAFLAGFYSKDLILSKCQITKKGEYNLFVDRLLNNYMNSMLHSDLILLVAYLLDFTEINNMYNDLTKIILWNHIVQIAVVTTDEYVFLEDDTNKLFFLKILV